jgi:SAM-dependent MidA family methyltransferase
VDYGYAAAGFAETLQAVAHNAFSALLEKPGESDLSAHVNFPDLAACAKGAGAEVYGPVGQGAFLKDLGLIRRAERLRAQNPGSADDVWKAVERLVGPDQMGTLFKAMAFVPKTAPRPPGF